MEDRKEINSFRKKNKRRHFGFGAAVLILLVIIFIILAANWEKLLAPFKDAALDVGKGGFPVTLPGSTEYVLGELGDNFYLLTDTYLYTYNSDGANIASSQHGFQDPVSLSNKKRVMVYDRNGKDFRFYSKSAEVYRGAVDDSIVFAGIGNDERCAVVTTSTRYSNYLYVFNGEGKRIFRWASPDTKIMQVCFSENDKSVFVTTLGEKGGELSLSLLRFDLDKADDYVWRVPLGSGITYALQCCPDGIYVVSEDGSFLCDKDTGEITASCGFTKTVFGIPDTDGLRAVLFRDSGSNGQTVAAYNADLEVVHALSPDSVEAFDVSGGRLYLLSGMVLTVYDGSFERINSYELDDTYSDVRIIAGNAYLLGYNTVQRLEL